MSRIVTTKLGRFRAVTDGDKKWWLWECPHCETWRGLSMDQLEGRASVYCDTRVPMSYGMKPGDTKACGYQGTHEYAKELAVTIQVRILFGQQPFEEDVEATP